MGNIGYIKRKSMLYRTKVEYGDWAMNHVQGCAHGCRYPCYAFMLAKRFGRTRSYEEWLKPYLVTNTLELLEKELPRYQHEINCVQLCFTTDPFMTGFPEVGEMSLDAIRLINSYQIPCAVLTKGILPMELSKLPQAKINEYGITLVSLSEQYRRHMEPGSANYSNRISALKKLHEAGCRTWVSIEPYPTPNIIEQDITEMLNKISFVNKIVFGRTHYDRKTSSYKNCNDFYSSAVDIVRNFCYENKIACHVKSGTLK